MKTINAILFFVFTILISTSVWAKKGGSFNISYCENGEKRLWACVTKNTVYEFCQPNSITKGNEYLRFYRGYAANGEKAEIIFPEQKTIAKNNFKYQSDSEAPSLNFTTDKFEITFKEESAMDISINFRVLNSKSRVTDGERVAIYYCGQVDGESFQSEQFKSAMVSLGLSK